MTVPTELPFLKAHTKLEITTPPTDFYDVKFYPYVEPGVDPIFAATGGRLTIVARPLNNSKQGFDILRCWREEDKDCTLNSITWSQDVDTGDPLLCISGKERDIKVYNVVSGELHRNLTGHGDLVNDLATSPLDPRIIASCSMDHTIRIWNLHRNARTSPCQIVIAGSHRDGVISIDFHQTGRFLLSGGHDTVVSMWSIPAISVEDPDLNHGKKIDFPLFTSTEVHSDYIDCLKWYEDWVLSKCAQENVITLWEIIGFNSRATELPAKFAVPENAENGRSLATYTRSAWNRGFERRLTFSAPGCELFFMRFGLFIRPDKHAVLAMGNMKGKHLFWDLHSLGSDASLSLPKKGRGGRRTKESTRDESPASVVTEGAASIENLQIAPLPLDPAAAEKALKKALGDPFRPIPAHKVINIPRYTFASRGIAFSPGGEWVVGAGDGGHVSLFRRWEADS